MDYYIGIEIGGTKLQLVTGDGSGTIRERRKLTVDREKGAAGIQNQIEQVLAEYMRRGNPAAVGVGFGGPVDWRTGRIHRSHHIEGWTNFEICQWLQKLTDAPVAADNDANVAGLAEARKGAGVGLNPVFYVTLGSGVGGGLVVDGQIYHGALPGEAEIGHVRLDRSGTTIESRCSGWAVDAKVRAVKNSQPTGLLAKLSADMSAGEAKCLGPALEQGDATADTILRETAEDLAFGLSHVVHLFHPELIVLGGGLSSLGEKLRLAVQNSLPNFVMNAFQPGPKIALSQLREDVVPIGTLILAETARRNGGI